MIMVFDDTEVKQVKVKVQRQRRRISCRHQAVFLNLDLDFKLFFLLNLKL